MSGTVTVSGEVLSELARLGSATVYEAGGRGRFVDVDLHQIVPGSRVAGRGAGADGALRPGRQPHGPRGDGLRAAR